MSFRISTKSFIVDKDNRLLILKRSEDDVHKPSIWEIPGGRLELGENPIEGLIRETKEETDLDIDVFEPLAIKHFTRQDKQKITMIVFLCKALKSPVLLSQEHTHYEWVDVKNAKNRLNEFFYPEIDNYNKHFLKQLKSKGHQGSGKRSFPKQ